MVLVVLVALVVLVVVVVLVVLVVVVVAVVISRKPCIGENKNTNKKKPHKHTTTQTRRFEKTTRKILEPQKNTRRANRREKIVDVSCSLFKRKRKGKGKRRKRTHSMKRK